MAAALADKRAAVKARVATLRAADGGAAIDVAWALRQTELSMILY